MTNADDLYWLAKDRQWLPPPEERKRIRVDAGMTLKVVADQLGITVSAMNSLERAPRPGDKHLRAYVAALKRLAQVSPAPKVSSLTAQEARELRERWENHACGSCGGLHTTAIKAPGSCPRIRRITYDSQGRVLEAEYWPEGRWPRSGIVWPDDLVVEE